MISGIHILLTYKCLYECDHCFVYSSPHAEGTFTYKQLCRVLDEATKIGTIKWIYFEGGEPFLYYPLLLEGIRIARLRGFKVGVVTNAYFGTTEHDAERWLLPLKKMKVRDLSISDDLFHNEGEKDSPGKIAYRAAKKLGIPVSTITIEPPTVLDLRGAERSPRRWGSNPKDETDEVSRKKGASIVGGGVMFRGRAADKLVPSLEGCPSAEGRGGSPLIPWHEFTSCPHEDFVNPERVHVDAYGHVHLCQGISMGNMWEVSSLEKSPPEFIPPQAGEGCPKGGVGLSELIKNYKVENHPIAKPISKGGPVRLAEEYKVEHEDSYVDACHLCYDIRKKLLLQGKFPQYLAPKQVYGM